MTLADDLRDLASRSLSALDASYNYHAHTEAVWRLLQQVVQEGRKFTVRSTPTGAVVSEQELADLAEDYVTGHLTSSTFQHFVSIFEDFFFDLLRLWLAAYPGSLAKKQVELGAVLKAGDVVAVALLVVDKELNELKYRRVADWFEYAEKVIKLGCPTVDEIETIGEIKASRDILVHNKGIANATYASKAGRRERCKEGERLEVPEQYHRESWETIKKIVRDLSGAAIEKA